MIVSGLENKVSLILFCFIILSMYGCREKDNIPLTVKLYTHKDIGDLPDSCYNIEVGRMTGWSSDIPEIEYYDKFSGNLYYYNYNKGIITFQGYQAFLGNTIIIEKIKKIDGKFKAFYIRWSKYHPKEFNTRSHYAPTNRNYFTDTTIIGTNLSPSEIKILLPQFRGKIYSELRDSLLFNFNSILPIEDLLKIKYKGEK